MERAPSTHCIGGWVGPRASLDAEVRGKILCLYRGSNTGHPVCSQTLYWLSYLALSFHISWLIFLSLKQAINHYLLIIHYHVCIIWLLSLPFTAWYNTWFNQHYTVAKLNYYCPLVIMYIFICMDHNETKRQNIPVLDKMKKISDPQELWQLHKVYCLQASALDFVCVYVLPILKMFKNHHNFPRSTSKANMIQYFISLLCTATKVTVNVSHVPLYRIILCSLPCYMSK
jgi:hypothetical protein